MQITLLRSGTQENTFHFLWVFSLDSNKHQDSQQQDNRMTLLTDQCSQVTYS